MMHGMACTGQEVQTKRGTFSRWACSACLLGEIVVDVVGWLVGADNTDKQ